MTKRYAVKWQRYFIKLLVNEPFFNDPEEFSWNGRSKTGRRRKAVPLLMAAIAVANSINYKLAYP